MSAPFGANPKTTNFGMILRYVHWRNFATVFTRYAYIAANLKMMPAATDTPSTLNNPHFIRSNRNAAIPDSNNACQFKLFSTGISPRNIPACICRTSVKIKCTPNHNVRLAITPTTAAVTPAKAADTDWFERSRSM